MERKGENTISNINKIALDILNAKERVENQKCYKDFCDTCTHTDCRNCDGRNHYKRKQMTD